ncbi:MAG: cytochrome c [Acidobacteria bacterium]|nr:MAG: cytochrome c [Acidobacteriota bacterium]REK06887.1 MAG: cytochrome c [Acidobacteriota bacterium]
MQSSPIRPSAPASPLRFAVTALLLAALATSQACSTPPGADELAEARRRGRASYLANCAPCHGVDADGHGPQGELLDSQPRDYTDPQWRSAATRASVRAAIADGVSGTAMPAWDLLPEQEIDDLTTYVLSVAEQGPRVDGVD